MTNFFCENLRRYLAGQPLVNLVDKRLGFPDARFAAFAGHGPKNIPSVVGRGKGKGGGKKAAPKTNPLTSGA